MGFYSSQLGVNKYLITVILRTFFTGKTQPQNCDRFHEFPDRPWIWAC
ncbi:hypothetical protein H6G93_29660 [Nostoc sp. FACHB-973]|nr:hypothetical protein [Nostoc sp. FACHB-973]